MDQPVPYEEDVFAWSRHQATLLRRIAQTRRDLPNDLDLEHVAEEIEDVGSEKLEAVISLLGNMLVHMLKLASSRPDADPANHWRREVRTWQRQVFTKYKNSMQQHVDLDGIWELAVRDARADLADEGERLIDVPRTCPVPLDALLAKDFDVSDAVGRIIVAVGADASDKRPY